MNERARTRGAPEVHALFEIPGQKSTQECTEVHAAEVHAPDPLFKGGGHLEEWEERLKVAVAETLRKREAKRKERQEFALRRMHGLAARHAAKLARINKEKTMTRPTTQCRYLTRNGNQCTGEPADTGIEAEALLCTRHIGNVLELLKGRGFTITAPAAEWCDDCKHKEQP